MQQTRDGNALLVSTLDSTIRLLDKGNGQLLQSYVGNTNQNYRIRSALALADAAVISGSEDGLLYVWDVLNGAVLEKLHAHGGKVASAVSWNSAAGKREWASAGSDGKWKAFTLCHSRAKDRRLGLFPCSCLRSDCRRGESVGFTLRLRIPLSLSPLARCTPTAPLLPCFPPAKFWLMWLWHLTGNVILWGNAGAR